MQIVIDIDEEYYKIIQSSTTYIDEVAKVCEDSVKGGKPLYDVLNQISEEVDDLRNFSYPFSDILLDDVEKILDKHKE